jgi:uncharacterized LabA/DUF88 family protein
MPPVQQTSAIPSVPAATTALKSNTAAPPPVRFQIFVDFWNLQLTLNRHEAIAKGVENVSFGIDWKKFPAVLVREAAKVLSTKDAAYAGMLVFSSYHPSSAADKNHHKWITGWLDREPGVHVRCFERQPRSRPKCQSCHREIEKCPHKDCGINLAGTVEKGVDTAIATDMIRLAWEQAYDAAVLVTSDADLVPAVKFLELKGIKVIQAGFPPYGADLAKACWGNFDMFARRNDYHRAIPTKV